MSRIEVTLNSGEHLSTGRYTAAEMADALAAGKGLEVHGPADPWPDFGAAGSSPRPVRQVDASDVRSWVVHG